MNKYMCFTVNTYGTRKYIGLREGRLGDDICPAGISGRFTGGFTRDFERTIPVYSSL